MPEGQSLRLCEKRRVGDTLLDYLAVWKTLSEVSRWVHHPVLMRAASFRWGSSHDSVLWGGPGVKTINSFTSEDRG